MSDAKDDRDHQLTRAPGLVIISQTAKGNTGWLHTSSSLSCFSQFSSVNAARPVSDKLSCTGRGVFASQNIPKDTVVDISPVLIFDEDEVSAHTSKTRIAHYA